MSVGSLKRLLLLANLGAVLLLGVVAFSFLGHKSAMGEPTKRPVFAPEPIVGGGERIGAIDHVTMKLGRFPEAAATTTETPTEEALPEIESVLARLGTIVGAIVVYPPYDPKGLLPSIIFEPKGQPTKRMSITLGQALTERPHPNPELARHGYTVPVAHKFVGCEIDPENSGWTYFLFDMKCDGTDIQKAHWSGEGPKKAFEAAKARDPNAPEYQGSGKGFFIGDPTLLNREPEKPRDDREKPITEAVPAPPDPLPELPRPLAGVPETLFEDESGRFAPTEEAVEYLKENYNDLLKDARTSTYVDPKTRQARGIQILGIRQGSVANKFGILPDDVILSINNVPVTRQAEAVNIVKRELNAGKHMIDVKILRRGREITQSYDTRDPAVRRQARNLRR